MHSSCWYRRPLHIHREHRTPYPRKQVEMEFNRRHDRRCSAGTVLGQENELTSLVTMWLAPFIHSPLFSCTSFSLILNLFCPSLFYTFYSSPKHLLSLVAMPRHLFLASCMCPSPTDRGALPRLQGAPHLTHSAGCHPEPGAEASLGEEGSLTRYLHLPLCLCSRVCVSTPLMDWWLLWWTQDEVEINLILKNNFSVQQTCWSMYSGK